eukprot:PhM_4_TR10314/c0_g1_i1/m.71309
MNPSDALQSEVASLKAVIKRMESEMERRAQQLHFRYRRDALESYFDDEVRAFVQDLEDQVSTVRKAKDVEIDKIRSIHEAEVTQLKQDHAEQIKRLEKTIADIAGSWERSVQTHRETQLTARKEAYAQHSSRLPSHDTWCAFLEVQDAMLDEIAALKTSSLLSNIKGNNTLTSTDVDKMEMRAEKLVSKITQLVDLSRALDDAVSIRIDALQWPACAQCGFSQSTEEVLASVNATQDHLEAMERDRVYEEGERVAEQHQQQHTMQKSPEVDVSEALDSGVVAESHGGLPDFDARAFFNEKKAFLQAAQKVDAATEHVSRLLKRIVSEGTRATYLNVSTLTPCYISLNSSNDTLQVWDVAQREAMIQSQQQQQQLLNLPKNLLVQPIAVFALKDVKTIRLGTRVVEHAGLPVAEQRHDDYNYSKHKFVKFGDVSMRNLVDVFHACFTLGLKTGNREVSFIVHNAQDYDAWRTALSESSFRLCATGPSYSYPDTWQYDYSSWLCEAEEDLLKQHHLSPLVYLFVRRTLVDEGNPLFVSVMDIHAASGWDYVSSRVVFEMMIAQGWVKERHVHVVVGSCTVTPDHRGSGVQALMSMGQKLLSEIKIPGL